MDVAIVGGGVSGCYCAHRLAHAHPDWDIRLFEASGRFGGRLWSVPLAGASGAPAEMGGMFISTQHRNVFALANHLKLKLRNVRWSQRHQYLRGVYLDNDTYTTDPEGVPFRLAAAEAGKNPIALLLYALRQIVPALDHIWPLNAEASPGATYDRLRRTLHQGRPLYECGFWNVLSDILSGEAYSLLVSTIGIGSIFRNANACEALWTLLRDIDPSQDYYRMADGYQQLPLALIDGVKDAIKIKPHHRLVAVERDAKAFVLRFETEHGETTKRARKLILALPRHALSTISFDDDLFGDPKEFVHHLDAVMPAPACRLYMAFEHPWWDQSVVGPSDLDQADVAAAFTDLPMRQCFYFGRPGVHDPALLLAAYTDDVAVSFWSGLGGEDVFDHPARDAADVETLQCSKAMVASARKQLSAMHHDKPVPEPIGALFVDWERDPFGAAWHDWAPTARSWRIGPKIRQPNPQMDWFICGEAYSQRQGWVEGAVNSAEMVLRRLGVGPPEWLDDPKDASEIEGEPNMTSKLSELVVALSESLVLQRAYGRDREAIMNAFGLSETEKAAIRTGDEAAIKALATGVGVLNTIISAGPK